MSYKKLQKQRNEIRSKLGEAKAELVELESEKEDLFKSLEEIEEKRIEAKAMVKVGNGSKEEAETVQAEYQKLKQKLDTVRDDIAVQERAISFIEQEKSEIESEFQKAARHKWRSVAGEHLDNIRDLMQQVQDEINTLNGFRKKMQQDGIEYPERSMFQGVSHYSQPVISKGKLGVQAQNFITTNNLNED